MESQIQIRVRGRVQGVGFRPFVWREAVKLGLVGEVRNDREGVLILAAGKRAAALAGKISESPPPLSEVHAIEVSTADFQPTKEFRIVESGVHGADTACAPDAASCAECLLEVAGDGRRAGYEFTNCTNCGPRFTILKALPYDRATTTMADFAMCSACRAEYDDPTDRRFHAQPLACPECGPSLRIEPASPEPLTGAVNRLLCGQIVALQGLGGFHLACDATNAAAVQTLRDRKRRPAKPFALMATLPIIRQHAILSEDEAALLEGTDAPIVLLDAAVGTLPEAIAPGLDRLGWMLPYTPLHYLIVKGVGRPLVMTSGNLSDEPQVISVSEAKEKLGPIADSILWHDRGIARRLDDSVVLPTLKSSMVVRRARGLTPGTIDMPETLPDRQVVAYGGELKAAICLTKNRQAMLSHHLGDLDSALSFEEFQRTDRDLADLMEQVPELIAVDMHPDYRASQYGRDRARAEGLPCCEVQHHHAHMAAALGSVGWTDGTAVGVILDGLGYGSDGSIWGGEILVGNYASFERLVNLALAPLPGGDAANREPWRNALMRLDAAGVPDIADRLFSDAPRDALRAAVNAGINAPGSSSAGRLFDAIAACLRIVPDRQTYEGEAAMRLEALANRAAKSAGSYEMPCHSGVLDPTPMMCALVSDLERGVSKSTIARRCHNAIADSFADSARKVASEHGATTIALSGGCLQNRLLLKRLMERLSDFEICGPGPVPVNDGGLAFGQALVALAQSGEE
ncbi:carbamoyltransferase HypF [Pseudaestuariivita atlantica]|uniref:carbamoyltransferase HypF n=1 Tax=Pseudaestuariivita atlantica TaxID=1317121 RepID=UPI0009E655EE|nr:carbamoyltransferase HypF [Pseudaestuariivita atlantica]